MEHYIPKTKPPCPSNIKDFNPIALLNGGRAVFQFNFKTTGESYND